MEVVCNLISYESTDWFCLPLSQEIGHIEYSARSQPSQRMRQKAWGKMLILKKKKKKVSGQGMGRQEFIFTGGMLGLNIN